MAKEKVEPLRRVIARAHCLRNARLVRKRHVATVQQAIYITVHVSPDWGIPIEQGTTRVERGAEHLTGGQLVSIAEKVWGTT